LAFFIFVAAEILGYFFFWPDIGSCLSLDSDTYFNIQRTQIYDTDLFAKVSTIYIWTILKVLQELFLMLNRFQ